MVVEGISGWYRAIVEGFPSPSGGCFGGSYEQILTPDPSRSEGRGERLGWAG
jgi:hypothetical protein